MAHDQPFRLEPGFNLMHDPQDMDWALWESLDDCDRIRITWAGKVSNNSPAARRTDWGNLSLGERCTVYLPTPLQVDQLIMVATHTPGPRWYAFCERLSTTMSVHQLTVRDPD